jgi:DNA-binding beta-propeller fold protein YncE
MTEQMHNSIQPARGWLALTLAIAMVAAPTSLAFGSSKKKETKEAPRQVNLLSDVDKANIVWPAPPDIARIKYMDYFAGEKLPDFNAKPEKKKSSWMDKLAGSPTGAGEDPLKGHYFMGEPHGMAVDSKGNLYVADSKVSVIFIINPETHDSQLIKNGKDADFGLIVGLAIDDSDRLFVSDPEKSRVVVFDPQHKVEGYIQGGLQSPTGLAIDNENRFLYVTDIGLDQVLVYDADTLQLLRKIGTAGKDHTLTAPGDFAKPTGAAVDSEGNLYVADMLNARIEVFDADGNFVRTFGKRGDGPGYFAMPKGVAVDSDGHIWVADSMQNKIQVFSPEGTFLISMGYGRGLLPGQFSGVQYLAIDNKNNRVYESEVFPGRVQEFRYVTQTEAAAQFKRVVSEAEKRAAEKKSKSTDKPAGKP